MIDPRSVPAATAGRTELADWLEIYALRSADRNSSIQDLSRALIRDGTIEELAGSDVRSRRGKYDELAVQCAESAFAELEDRSRACGGGYPFKVEPDYIELLEPATTAPYLFFLLLSTTLHERTAKTETVARTKLFEIMCAEAGRRYFGGAPTEACVFGFPRRVGNQGFVSALDDLCHSLGEGMGHKRRPTIADKKDASLDVVVWRGFPDGRPGKLIGFGQCATGRNWRAKLTELQADAFWDTWILERPVHPPIRLFFTPYRLDEQSWYEDSRKGGLFFDRCRIVAALTGSDGKSWRDAAEWVKEMRKALLR